MTPEDFIDTIASPNISEALKAPDDDRLVFNACASLEALASKIYWLRRDGGLPSEDRDGPYKTELSERSEAFDIIHAVAEAQKHEKLTANSAAGRPVQLASSIRSRPHGFDLSPWGEMMFDVDKAIAIEVSGVLRTIAPIAQKALQFLRQELVAARADIEGQVPSGVIPDGG